MYTRMYAQNHFSLEFWRLDWIFVLCINWFTYIIVGFFVVSLGRPSELYLYFTLWYIIMIHKSTTIGTKAC